MFSLLFKSLQKIMQRVSNWTLVANLPYIPSDEIKYAKKYNIYYEPSIALYSGKDGLDCFRDLINQIKFLNNKPKQCFFELDPRNIHQAKKIMEKHNGSIWAESELGKGTTFFLSFNRK